MHIDPTLMSVSGCALGGVVVWAADEEPMTSEHEDEPAEPAADIEAKEPAAP